MPLLCSLTNFPLTGSLQLKVINCDLFAGPLKEPHSFIFSLSGPTKAVTILKFWPPPEIIKDIKFFEIRIQLQILPCELYKNDIFIHKMHVFLFSTMTTITAQIFSYAKKCLKMKIKTQANMKSIQQKSVLKLLLETYLQPGGDNKLGSV